METNDQELQESYEEGESYKEHHKSHIQAIIKLEQAFEEHMSKSL